MTPAGTKGEAGFAVVEIPVPDRRTVNQSVYHEMHFSPLGRAKGFSGQTKTR